MIRALARATLIAALAVSLAITALTGLRIARDPLLAPLRDRAADQIAAATDRMMAREATPERLAELIAARLGEQPRNWVAIRALEQAAAEQKLILPQATAAAIATAWDDDTGILAQAGDCAICAWDPASCTLSNVLICQAPVALTPVGDIAGIARAGVAYATGGQIDQIDLALSIVGLGATALVVASGGSSAMVKAGASTAKLARRMGLLSPRLTALATDAVRTGVNWAALPAVRSTDDLALAIRADAFAPLIATATDLERLRTATGTTAALHLLPLIDDAGDARRLARLGEALGPRLVARAEVLGKARLLRATLRVSETAVMLMTGLLGLMWSIAAMIGGALQSAGLRLLRRSIPR